MLWWFTPIVRFLPYKPNIHLPVDPFAKELFFLYDHDDVIKWKHFPRYWPFVPGIHRGQCGGALMFSLICVWINAWVHNREAADLRRHRAHYVVIVMLIYTVTLSLIGCAHAQNDPCMTLPPPLCNPCFLEYFTNPCFWLYVNFPLLKSVSPTFIEICLLQMQHVL